MRIAFDRQNYIDYYEEISQKYPEGEIVMGSLVGRLRIKRLLNYLDIFSKEGGLVLDAGCSNGVLLLSYIKEKDGRKAVGIDIGSGNLKNAFSTAKDLEVERNTYFLVGDCVDLPFKNNSFDTLICSEVIEHLFEPDRAINEFDRVLKSEGILIVTTPNPLHIFKKINPTFWCKCVLSSLKSVVLVEKTYEISTTPAVEKYGVTPTRYKHTEFAPFELEKMLPSTFKLIDLKSIIFPLPLLQRWSKSETLLSFFSKICETCPILSKLGIWSVLVARKK
ncbi:class I SAM-dependent methyltransferase [Methanoculleus sp.]|uniref:class I SAM-dependent methyltransferase n=1 Tax=Methanoculleus sp. TaxID=90427 RepID=UPI00260C1FE9|nr:class I SAM-dependent methyltransferase [Methanoculleus sp.]MDI6867744.1 class I SAM-dependent methyltransferase [Methanoculleus sp.]